MLLGEASGKGYFGTDANCKVIPSPLVGTDAAIQMTKPNL